MIQVCDFLADILAEFMRTDRSRLGSESACASASGLGRRAGTCFYDSSCRVGIGYLLVVAGMGRAT